MIRILRAFTWLRWRLLVNSLRGADRRDALERASRVAALVVPGLLVAASVSSIVSAAVLGSLAGWASVTHVLSSAWVLPMIRLILLVATVLAVLVPLFVGVRGGAGYFTRLLLLPIPPRALHFVEVLTSLTEPWLAFIVPGLCGYAFGMLAAAFFGGEAWYHGRTVDGVFALAAGLGMAFTLASLSSLVAFLVSWLVRDRRRSEIFVVVFVLVLSCVSIVPALISSRLQSQRTDSPDAISMLKPPAEALPGEPPPWTVVLPSELYFQSVRLAEWWPRRDAVLPLSALYLEGAFLFWFSSVVHRRRVESAEGGRTRRHRVAAGRGPIRIPGFWPGTSAVAIAQMRTALRSVRGRLVVLLPGPLVAMLALLFRSMPHPRAVESLIASQGYLACGAGILFALYAAQALTMNQFGSDRAGLTLQFLAPIRDVDIVRGKTVGCGIVVGSGALVSLLCAAVAAPGGSLLLWLATLAGGAAAFLILSPATAWLSALLPVASNLSKTDSGGNPHSLTMLAGAVLVGVSALPAGLILALFTPRVALAVMLLWLLAAAVFAYLLLGVVARSVKLRRENLALVAQGR